MTPAEIRALPAGSKLDRLVMRALGEECDAPLNRSRGASAAVRTLTAYATRWPRMRVEILWDRDAGLWTIRLIALTGHGELALASGETLALAVARAVAIAGGDHDA